MDISVYLCYMDKNKLIKEYEGGKAISALAKEFGVSRQAIQGHLKRAGVYKKDEVTPQVTPPPKGLHVTSESDNEVTPPIKKKKPSETFALYADWKKAVYCAIDEIVEVDLDLMDGGYVRLARNLYANKDGYVIRHYHDGELLVERYDNAEAIHAKYDKALEGRVPVRHPWMV